MRPGAVAAFVAVAATAIALLVLRTCGEEDFSGAQEDVEVSRIAGESGADSGAVETGDAERPAAGSRRAARPGPLDAGAEADSADPSARRRDHRVTFIVCRAEDRSPIEGARVLVRDGAGHREFATDGEGRAEIRVVGGGIDYGVLADDRARQQGSVRVPPQDTLEFFLDRGAQAAGRITDAETGRPIEGAFVMVRVGGFDGFSSQAFRGDWEVGHATADAEGRFRIPGLTRSIASTLRASAPGYVAAEVPLVPLALGRIECDVALLRGRTIRVDVLDPSGAPFPGAIMTVHPAPGGVPRHSPFGEDGIEGRTDGSGRFSTEGLARDGWYRVAAYPGAELAPAESDVPPGPGDAEVVLRLGPLGSITVVALDDAGQAVSGATAYVSDAADGTDFLQSTPADGVTTTTLRPGSYRVWLAQDLLDPPRWEEVTIASGERRRVELRRGPGAMFSGRVVDPAGRPLEGVQVFVSTTSGVERSVAHDTDDEGRFEIAGLPPGRWTVRFSASHQLVLSGSDWLEAAAVVDLPFEPREWRLVPACDAHLRLPAEALGRWVKVSVESEWPSEFLRESGWSVEWDDFVVQPQEATDEFSLRMHASRPLRFRFRVDGFLPVVVEVPAPTGEDFDVVLPPLVRGVRVPGKVVDEGGRPVWADVRVLLPEEIDCGRNDPQDGTFSTHAVPPGPVLLAVRPSSGRAERTVRVVAREGMDPVEVVVTRGGVLDVLCTGADGVPLPGRKVLAAADGDGPLEFDAATDHRGRATLRVHAGTWRVRTEGATVTTADVAEGATATVKLVVR